MLRWVYKEEREKPLEARYQSFPPFFYSEPHSSVYSVKEDGRSLFRSSSRPIFFPRTGKSRSDRIHSSLTAVHCFDYVGKQPVAWEEYCAECWLKELQESIDRCTGRHGMTEILLKKGLTLSQPSPGFYVSTVQVFLKTLREKDELLVTSNSSFSHSVFYLFGKRSAIFIKSEIVLCKLF